MDPHRLPSGSRERQALVDWAVEQGDKVENHYLELKSDLDPASKEGTAKLVKFILGTSNRMPEDAARFFDGRAIMLIGVGAGQAPGIPARTEEHELSDRLTPYLGDEPTLWSMERLPLPGGEREVLFIITDPPTAGDPLRPCRRQLTMKDEQDKNRQLLQDGGVYVRDRTQSIMARAGAIDRLSRRAQDTGMRDFEVEVALPNSLQTVPSVEEKVQGLFDNAERAFRDQHLPPAARRGPFDFANNFPHPAVEMFKPTQSHLDRWMAARAENVARALALAYGTFLPGLAIGLSSPSKFLDRPRLEVRFEDCSVYDWEDPSDFGSLVLVPNIANQLHSQLYLSSIVPRQEPGGRTVLNWFQDGQDVVVQYTPESLHPGVPALINDHALALRPHTAPGGTVHATWHLTAHGHDTAHTGTKTIPVTAATVEPIDANEDAGSAQER